MREGGGKKVRLSMERESYGEGHEGLNLMEREFLWRFDVFSAVNLFWASVFGDRGWVC